MTTLVFFLEEPSAKEMLQGVLPRVLPESIHYRFIVFKGKQDLEKNLLLKLRSRKQPDCSFIVMLDQDANDCRELKSKLSALCQKAGKESAIVRIACRELESFYLGDLQAVEKGLQIKGLSRQQLKKRLRDPDMLQSPSKELIKMTNKVYDKISGSRAIAPHLNLQQNRSHSFSVLLSGLMDLCR